MKKLILILGGISVVLFGVVFVLYKNNQSANSEVVDIFKEDDSASEEEDIADKEISTKVYVDIKGMVVNPGVYEVDSKARVSDVIELAGGLLSGADTSLINLAKIVADEMTIVVYSSEEAREKYLEELCNCRDIVPKNDALVEAKDDDREREEKVNINTAIESELTKVDGIGEAKAKAIIDYREKNGNFKTIDDIKNVSGIGDALFEKIKAYITV